MGEAAEQLDTDVLVVGAGPSGLMAAVCLAKLGVDAVIVDGKQGPTRESRALAVQARSMELYDQLGLVDRVLAERSSATSVVPGAGRGRPFGRIRLRALGTGVTPYPEITVFEQSRNEQLLVDALGELGREVRWGHRLERLEVEPGAADAAASVTATLAGPDGPVAVRARYCIGADGAHSIVRETLGIPFEGVTNEHTFYVADASGVTGLVGDAINVRVTAEHFLLAFPMGPGRARLLGVVRDRDRDEHGELPEALVRGMLDREFGVGYAASAWFTTYRLHHRLAARFRDGPCFLVGDAAHIHSPVGAQGMNTGLQEAHDLACALADVVVGGMPDARLDRYEAERRPVGRILVATTDRAFAAVTSDSATARFLRGRVVPLVGPVAVRLAPLLIGGRRVFGYLSQTRIRYPVPDAAGTRRDGAVGVRLRWTGGNFDALRSLQWQVHGYGVPERAVRRIAAELGVEAHVFARDRGRPRRARLRADRVYLVRRDGFVVAEVLAPGTGSDLDAARARLAGF
ncbi:2-polyprenyl-6-methoxyphenol hydroxylase-like FAD-dependent oxidoreductase [Agromyces cerinus]|uniref:FAD-dependent monooxygenase n=1 Tax=Agromyces cerinus TaxID=33878 RepID=UPI00195A29C9|nr:FAD-dependent monooxygenase [Agromyces cerinus]MBM7832369.1 2-polyprenyl-6-methoxyphenol hydroxylase-like FAD-dependent oxidoreductase [Agromyces cerinus]